VSRARVLVGEQPVGGIGVGLLVLIGVAGDDGPADVAYVAGKIRDLRVFEDGQGKMNRSLADVGGSVLAVSQFTLYGDSRKGRRPSFDRAAPAETGRVLFEAVIAELRAAGVAVETGTYRAHMQVELVNDGPVTILLDSRKQF
jgi:D-tyrosyl-tRNA(Tyr) deacylase